jgi:hypothetical protein
MVPRIVKLALLVILIIAVLASCSGQLAYHSSPYYYDDYRYDDYYYYDYYSDCPRFWMINPRCGNCHWY